MSAEELNTGALPTTCYKHQDRAAQSTCFTLTSKPSYILLFVFTRKEKAPDEKEPVRGGKSVSSRYKLDVCKTLL